MKYVEKTFKMKVPAQFAEAEPVNLVLEMKPERLDDRFGIHEWNRNLKTSLLNKLRESLPKHGQLIPGIVDKVGNIDEGNHRFFIDKEQNIPFKFIIRQEDIDNESYVDIVNTIQESWKLEDYLHKFVTQGKKAYVDLKAWMDKPENKLDIANALAIISQQDRDTIWPHRETLVKDFKEGRFNPSEEDWENANIFISHLETVAETWGGEDAKKAVKKKPFILAYLSAKKVEDFSHDIFIERLKKQTLVMRECVKANDYLRVMTDIFNHGLQRVNKIHLV